MSTRTQSARDKINTVLGELSAMPTGGANAAAPGRAPFYPGAPLPGAASAATAGSYSSGLRAGVGRGLSVRTSETPRHVEAAAYNGGGGGGAGAYYFVDASGGGGGGGGAASVNGSESGSAMGGATGDGDKDSVASPLDALRTVMSESPSPESHMATASAVSAVLPGPGSVHSGTWSTKSASMAAPKASLLPPGTPMMVGADGVPVPVAVGGSPTPVGAWVGGGGGSASVGAPAVPVFGGGAAHFPAGYGVPTGSASVDDFLFTPPQQDPVADDEVATPRSKALSSGRKMRRFTSTTTGASPKRRASSPAGLQGGRRRKATSLRSVVTAVAAANTMARASARGKAAGTPSSGGSGTPRSKKEREATKRDVETLKRSVTSLHAGTQLQAHAHFMTKEAATQMRHQVDALKAAFSTLSKAVLDVSEDVTKASTDVHRMRKGTAAGFDEVEQRRRVGDAENKGHVDGLKVQVRALTDALEALQARDEERTAEVSALRAQINDGARAHRALRDELDSLKETVAEDRAATKVRHDDADTRASQLAKELLDVRDNAKKEAAARERSVFSLRKDVREQVEKRVADLEVLEEALTSSQRQFARLREAVDESLSSTAAELHGLRLATSSAADLAEACRGDAASLQRTVMGATQDAKRRYDDLARVVEGVSDAMRRLTAATIAGALTVGSPPRPVPSPTRTPMTFRG